MFLINAFDVLISVPCDMDNALRRDVYFLYLCLLITACTYI